MILKLQVSSLKTQVSQLVARLQESHQDVEERSRVGRNLEHEVYLKSQATQDLNHKRGELERDVLLLKAELDKRVNENASLRNDLQVQEAAIGFEKKRADKLESLMRDERRKQLEFVERSGDGTGTSRRENHHLSTVSVTGDAITSRMDDESEQATMMLYDPA